MKYWIKFKGEKQHKTEASSDEEAIRVWANEQGYDCIEEAAREYYGDVKDFTAHEMEEEYFGLPDGGAFDGAY